MDSTWIPNDVNWITQFLHALPILLGFGLVMVLFYCMLEMVRGITKEQTIYDYPFYWSEATL